MAQVSRESFTGTLKLSGLVNSGGYRSFQSSSSVMI